MLTLSAADVSGKWSGNVTAPGGEITTGYFDLRQTGEELSGTAGPSAQTQWPIRKGSIRGTKLEFEVAMPDQGVMRFDLTVEGERIQGEMSLVKGGEVQETSRIAVSRVR